ncbi:MAG: type II toxin-antitoxin system HicB family antitoxin [Hormoscilla sp.]
MNRLELRVEYSFDVESGAVIATVPDLNYVSSFGKDFASAKKNVTEAVQVYLEASFASRSDRRSQIGNG